MARSSTRHRHSFFATVALLIFAVAPIALAQSSSKAKKKGAKPSPSASASASASAPEEPTPPETVEAPPPAAPPASTTPPEAGTVSVEDLGDDITNTAEDPTKTYKFVGARYRGTIIPAFFEHIFVKDGGTVYSNTIGAEFDFRKDGHSNIIWLQYTEYGFGNTLFFQKGQPDQPNNYSIVSSSLKSVYAGIDELWSTPLANHLELEYGLGVGLGVLFGNLYNDWVYQTSSSTPGAIQDSANKNYYAPCNSVLDSANNAHGDSCQPSNHSGATVAKVGNYVEKNWANGGAVPLIFPQLAGQIGLRYKPIKQLETRLAVGVSLTGFWFGLSADYGLEDTSQHDSHPAAKPPATDPSTSGDERKSSREVGLRDTL
jgi:hypothetical protein